MLQDLLEKAKQLVQNVTEIVKDAANKAFEKLKDLKNTIEKLAEDGINAAKTQIEEITAKAKDTIQKIIEQATGNGIDIKECMIFVDELNNLPKKLLENEVKCVTKEVQTGQQIISDSMNTIEKIYDGVHEFPSRLQDCLKEPLSAIKCVIGVINDMIKLETTAPMQIAQEVKRVIDYVAGFKTRIQKCAADQVINAQKETLRIVSDMRKCVANHKP